jgi:hypothetical protein
MLVIRGRSSTVPGRARSGRNWCLIALLIYLSPIVIVVLAIGGIGIAILAASRWICSVVQRSLGRRGGPLFSIRVGPVSPR